jgi:voltage-gated potassium channel
MNAPSNGSPHTRFRSSPSLPLSVAGGLTLVDLVVGVLVGLWIPPRIVYFSHERRMAGVDYMVDLVVLLLVATNLAWRWWNARRGPRMESWLYGAGSLSLDLLVALPLCTLLVSIAGDSARYTLLVKLLLLRRVFSIPKLLDEFTNLHPVLARLIPLGFVVPLTVNLVACGWSWIGGGSAGSSPSRTVDYVRAVYWTITTLTTVGYGDITPKTLPQMLYAAATMLIGIGFFGYVLGNVASLFSRLDAAREQYLELRDRVETFMQGNDVPGPLRTRVREYYRYLWRSRKGWNVSTVLADLPPKLRIEMALCLNSEIFEKVPMLRGADSRLREEIVLELKPRVIIPQEEVFRIGDPGDAMYFIQHGEIEIIAADGSVLATLGPGSFFGESALLTARTRNASARAADYCDVFVLKHEAFERVLNRHPDFRRQVEEIAAQRSGGSRSFHADA